MRPEAAGHYFRAIISAVDPLQTFQFRIRNEYSVASNVDGVLVNSNRNLARFSLLLLLTMNVSVNATKDSQLNLADVQWIHGSPNCESSRTESNYLEWQKVQYGAGSYVFRQNKCSNYEAPFVYLFVGDERALLIDTGATEEGGSLLVAEIRTITDLPVIVAHSHGHGDHRAGDSGVRDSEGFTVVGIGPDAVQAYFGFEDWPLRPLSFDLGARSIELLPIPGHHDDDIAIYDLLSKVVITGDTFYPGRLYIRSWSEYRSSISRLVHWIQSKEVRYILGTHIEMSADDNVDYPIRTTYQPDELPLPLTPSDLHRLHEVTSQMAVPERTYLNKFIIWPKQ